MPNVNRSALFKRYFIPYLMVAIAAVLWGGIGIFIEYLHHHNFTSLEIVGFRVLTAAIILFAYLQLKKSDELGIKLSHIPIFLGTGILSISLFNWSYFTAIRETSLSIAVVLLYTGPAFVVLLSRIFFKEAITPQKFMALLFTLIGVMMVAEFTPGANSISGYGLVTGLTAGFGYALYSIFSKTGLKHYSPLTIIFYTFLFASLFMVPLSGIYSIESLQRLSEPGVLWMIIGLGFFPTVAAYLLYTEGLKRMEAGNASLTAMVEPVAATIFGIYLFGDVLSKTQFAGIIFVLLSVLLIHVRLKKSVRI